MRGTDQYNFKLFKNIKFEKQKKIFWHFKKTVRKSTKKNIFPVAEITTTDRWKPVRNWKSRWERFQIYRNKPRRKNKMFWRKRKSNLALTAIFSLFLYFVRYFVCRIDLKFCQYHFVCKVDNFLVAFLIKKSH